MPVNLSFLRGSHSDLNKILKKANGTLTEENYCSELGITENLSAADIRRQYEAIEPAVEGAFYLTTDSKRLYTGIYNSDMDRIELEELNRSISFYPSFTAFRADKENLEEGHFYYMETENILAVCKNVYDEQTGALIGKNVVQINPDDDTKIDSVLLTTKQYSTNKAVILTEQINSYNATNNNSFQKNSSIILESNNATNLAITQSNNNAKYIKTADQEINADKDYYIWDEQGQRYEVVEQPKNAELTDYYEFVTNTVVTIAPSTYTLKYKDGPSSSVVNTTNLGSEPQTGYDDNREPVKNVKINLNKNSAEDNSAIDAGTFYLVEDANVIFSDYIDPNKDNSHIGLKIAATDTKLQNTTLQFNNNGQLTVGVNTTTDNRPYNSINATTGYRVSDIASVRPEIIYGVNSEHEYSLVSSSTDVTQLDNNIRYYKYITSMPDPEHPEETISLDPGIYVVVTNSDEYASLLSANNLYTRNESNAFFNNGIAELDVYSKEQIDNKIRTSLQSYNALQYKDVLNSKSQLTNLSQIQSGDVYIIGSPFDGYDIGDLLIASGDESAAGYLTNTPDQLNTVTWNHVPSGDDEFTAYLYKNGYVVSQNNIDRKLIEIDKGAGQSSLQINTSATVETVYTLTTDTTAQTGKTYYSYNNANDKYNEVNDLVVDESSVTGYYEKTGKTGVGDTGLTGIKTTVSLVWGSF